MFVICGEKDGVWTDIETEDEREIDTIAKRLENDGYGRISVFEK